MDYLHDLAYQTATRGGTHGLRADVHVAAAVRPLAWHRSGRSRSSSHHIRQAHCSGTGAHIHEVRAHARTAANVTPDQDSVGKPKERAQALLDAKHGDANSVVMVKCCDTTCPIYGAACTLAKDYFPCLSRAGRYRRLGDAVAGAVSPAMTMPGTCNEGFLRDDALLMVTIIGPPDQDSLGKPKEWAQAFLDAKHGDADSVAMFRICDATGPVYDAACTSSLCSAVHSGWLLPGIHAWVQKSSWAPVITA